jgi:hypothetical protein
MTHGKLIIGVGTGLLLVTAASPVLAQNGQSDTLMKLVDDTARRVTDTGQTVGEDVSEALPGAFKGKKGRDSLHSHVAALKAEIKQQKESRKAKLEGRRLARCENRQDLINTLLDKSVAVGRARLTRIGNIASAVEKFYTDQKLSSADYGSALSAVAEKQASAQAAIDVMDDEQFNCENVDGDKPAGTLRTLRLERRAALQEYRDAVKRLIDVVGQALSSKDAGEETGR